MKQCKKCNEHKPVTEFHKHKGYKDGLSTTCKPCAIARTREWSLENPERKKASYRAWVEANLERCAKVSAAWRLKNEEYLKDYHAKAYIKNKERDKARANQWYLDNKEYAHEMNRVWRKNNPEKTKAYTKAWELKNPEAKRTRTRNRRAKLRNAGGTHTPQDIQNLLVAQKGLCVYCHIDISDCYQGDHIHPVALGGSNWPWNIQLLCRLCNSKKWMFMPEVFEARLRKEEQDAFDFAATEYRTFYAKNKAAQKNLI